MKPHVEVEKYRLGYAIYRRNVPLDSVVYGEKGGKVQYCKVENEDERVEEFWNADETVNDVDGPNRKTYKILYNSNNKFWTASALVPQSFMGLFVGVQSANKKKIEQSTECTITIPDRKKHGPVVIKSTVGAEQVEQCIDQIEKFVAEQRVRTRPTHFVALALQSDELAENYNEFCLLVKNSRAVQDESKLPELFMPQVKLHLTLCMLALLSDSDITKAKNALAEIVEIEIRPLLKERPLTINVKGLERFGNEDATKTRVIFGKVTGVQLLEVAEIINKKMASTGLAKIEERDFTLHMTIMNSKYVKTSGKKGNTFDSNMILRDFQSFNFGSCDVNEVKICALSTDASTGNYVTTHFVPFNSSDV